MFIGSLAGAAANAAVLVAPSGAAVIGAALSDRRVAGAGLSAGDEDRRRMVSRRPRLRARAA